MDVATGKQPPLAPSSVRPSRVSSLADSFQLKVAHRVRPGIGDTTLDTGRALISYHPFPDDSPTAQTPFEPE
jgi:hypothetical protein